MPARLPCFGALCALLLALTGCAHDGSADESAPAGAHAAGRTAVAPTPHPAVHHAPPCSADDLVARFRPEREGAGGHLLALLDLRNASSARCLLSGYPRRVTISEPGRRAVRATRGSFFPAGPSRPMAPGEVTTLGVETDAYCRARPTRGPPGPTYHEVTVSLRGGVLRVAAPRGGLDVGCGVHLSRFTAWR